MFLSREGRQSAQIAAIVCIALIVRAALPIIAYAASGAGAVFEAPDTSSYIHCAGELARGKGFTTGGVPEIVRTPGYPLFLLPGLLLGHVTAVTVILQVFVGCLTVWLVCRITLALTGKPGAAVAAGLLMALEPLSVLYCSRLLAETLFTSLLMLFLYLFILSLRERRSGYLFASAFALAAAVYVRPIAYWLPVLGAIFLVAASWKKRSLRPRSLLKPLSFLGICAVLIGAWQVRNKMETGYGGFSAITDYYLYFYQGAAVVAAETDRSYYAVQREMGYYDMRIYIARHPEQEGMPPARRLAAMGKEGREIILSHPLTFTKIYANGLIRTLLDPGAIDYLKLLGLYPDGGGLLGEVVDRGIVGTVKGLAFKRPVIFFSSLLLGIVLLFYLGLALVALLRRARFDAPFAALAVTGLYVLLLSGRANALGRFRDPLMPIICVLAGCGLELIRPRRKPRP